MGSDQSVILMVEDNCSDIMLTTSALRETKSTMQCEVAEDGEMAVDLLWGSRQLKPDLIMIDISLPKLGGKELLRQIKGDERLRSIPTIMMSGLLTKADRVQSMKWKADDCIDKPDTYRDYCNMVRNIEDRWIRKVA